MRQSETNKNWCLNIYYWCVHSSCRCDTKCGRCWRVANAKSPCGAIWYWNDNSHENSCKRRKIPFAVVVKIELWIKLMDWVSRYGVFFCFSVHSYVFAVRTVTVRVAHTTRFRKSISSSCGVTGQKRKGSTRQFWISNRNRIRKKSITKKARQHNAHLLVVRLPCIRNEHDKSISSQPRHHRIQPKGKHSGAAIIIIVAFLLHVKRIYKCLTILLLWKH